MEAHHPELGSRARAGCGLTESRTRHRTGNIQCAEPLGAQRAHSAPLRGFSSRLSDGRAIVVSTSPVYTLTLVALWAGVEVLQLVA